MDQQIYYHFLSTENAIDDLQNEWIKVSTFDDLNDPFEMLPYLRLLFAERQPYHKVRRDLVKKFGLLCFTSDWNEPLLWSYYADKHKGVVLGFEVLQDDVMKVDYSDNLKRQKVELTSDTDQDEKSFLDLAKFKYGGWKHEEEYRIQVNLDGCEKKDKGYFLKFSDRLKVREIILGCKFDHKSNQERIIKLAKEIGADEIIATREEWEGFQIRKDGTKSKQYNL